MKKNAHQKTGFISLNALFLAMLLSVLSFNYAATAATMPTPSSIKGNNCFSCHAQNQTIMGPSWQAIKARYQDKSNASDTLSQSIMKGVNGKWGDVPMPSNPQLSDADAQAIVNWILKN